MLAFFRHLQQRWGNWCGDADMEKAIRRQLSKHGYYGGSAQLRSVRLAAVQRPGWLQVYRFEVTARAATSAAINGDSVHPAESVSLHREDDPSHRGDDPPASAVYHELFGLVKEDHRHNQTSVRVFVSNEQRRELFDRWSEGLIQLRGGRALTCN